MSDVCDRNNFNAPAGNCGWVCYWDLHGGVQRNQKGGSR